MSTHTYAVRDEGLIAKGEERNVKNLCDYIKEHEGITLKPDLDENEDIYDAIRNFISEESQWYLGKGYQNGVICHKWSYGNDIDGDFIPLLKDVNSVDIDVGNDDWVIMCLPKYPSLFKQAYKNEDDLITKMRKLYGAFLPENFDYRERLVELSAMAWG